MPSQQQRVSHPCSLVAFATVGVGALGWRYAFMPLAIGPFLGVWAMARLRAHPDSIKLAGGRR